MRPEDAPAPAELRQLEAASPLWGDEGTLNAAVTEIERFGVAGASGGAASRPLAHAVGEAVASSRIEGVRSTSAAVLAQMALGGPRAGDTEDDARAAGNARALLSMLDGIDAGSEIDLASIARSHELLYEGVSYGPGERTGHAPGEWRRTQNWIVGGQARDVIYTPPAPADVVPLMENLVDYVNSDGPADHALVRCAVAHAQFEAIHPFPDGNGRVGRILASIMMRKYGLLSSHVLGLSTSLYMRRAQYYALLRGVTASGAWGQWISYFVDACVEAAEDGTRAIRDLVGLRASCIKRLGDRAGEGTVQVVDRLFENPFITIPMAKRITGMGNRGAAMIIEDAVEAGILERMPEHTKTILFVSREILAAMGGRAEHGEIETFMDLPDG